MRPEYRGIEQLEARRAHNPEVGGSSPPPATRKEKVIPTGMAFFFFALEGSCVFSPGYETDERSSLGKRGERRRGREERPERSAAVDIFEAAVCADENIGHRKPGCRTDFR